MKPLPLSELILQAGEEPRIAQLVALFNALDERGKVSTLAMLAVAVKLHPKEQ